MEERTQKVPPHAILQVYKRQLAEKMCLRRRNVYQRLNLLTFMFFFNQIDKAYAVNPPQPGSLGRVSALKVTAGTQDKRLSPLYFFLCLRKFHNKSAWWLWY